MAEKNIYELLNDIETDLTEYPEWHALSDAELERIRKNVTRKLRHQKNRFLFTAAACAALLLGGFALHPFSGTARESEVRYVSSFPTISSYLGAEKDLSPYEQMICQTDISGGISVSIDAIILDDHTLFVSAGTDDRSSEAFRPSASITANGQKTEYASSDFACAGSTTETGQLMILEFELPYTVDTEKPVNIDLTFCDTDKEKSSRKWDFSFTASAEKTTSNTSTIPLNHTFSLPDGSQIRLTELRCSDLRQIIRYEADRQTKDCSNWYLKGTDSAGNILLFRSHYSDSSGGFLQLNPDESDFSREASCLTLQPVFSTQEPLQKDASPQQKILRQLGKVLPGDWRSTPLGESFSIHLNQ